MLLAPVCAACRRPLDEPTRGAVCAPCWSSIVPLTPPCCRTCGEPLRTWRREGLPPKGGSHGDGGGRGGDAVEDRCFRCEEAPPALVFARAVGRYEGSLRDILHALKYDGRSTIARPLAARMRAAGQSVLDGADLVVPVPLHRSRERSRGFNQARELAKRLACPMADALVRTRKTMSQADLTAAKRRANVRGAFQWRGRALAGLTVVVVDDVSTTGATLNACAGALLDAGAKEVRALTAAKAVAMHL